MLRVQKVLNDERGFQMNVGQVKSESESGRFSVEGMTTQTYNTQTRSVGHPSAKGYTTVVPTE
eukprot:6303445-Amphidinium_carterae.1